MICNLIAFWTLFVPKSMLPMMKDGSTLALGVPGLGVVWDLPT
jgi:hypothetical protein